MHSISAHARWPWPWCKVIVGRKKANHQCWIISTTNQAATSFQLCYNKDRQAIFVLTWPLTLKTVYGSTALLLMYGRCHTTGNRTAYNKSQQIRPSWWLLEINISNQTCMNAVRACRLERERRSARSIDRAFCDPTLGERVRDTTGRNRALVNCGAVFLGKNVPGLYFEILHIILLFCVGIIILHIS